MSSNLPPSYQALFLENFEKGFEVKILDTPRPDPGSAIVRILSVSTLSYAREIYNGEQDYTMPKPLVGGFSAVARVAALGLDAIALKHGQLVFVDCVIRGRDDPGVVFLSAIHDGFSEGSKTLFKDAWRNGTFAEYAKVPLENCISLDEVQLCQNLQYTVHDLTYISCMLVSYGGLRAIELQPGETIVICPSTGNFGGAAVQVAVSMGARVIAMGRNEVELMRLRAHVTKGVPNANIAIVKNTEDEVRDAATLQHFGVIDAVLDFSPFAAVKATHMKSALRALRRGGRISLMGFTELPTSPELLWKIVSDNITFTGKFMYERDDMIRFVKMLENGLFPRGDSLVDTKVFNMEDWRNAFDEASQHTGVGKQVVMTPDFR